MKVPSQSQTIDTLGKKPVSDLIGANFKLSVNGTTVTATGDVMNITEPWTEFDSKSGNTGHFVPLILPVALKGQKIVVGGRTDGDRTIAKMDDDLILVVRLENLKADKKLAIKHNNELVMTVDFSGVTKK